MASSAIVIKVKYGKTLRRFNASIHDEILAPDIVMFREKIRSLFSFDADADFTLTYVDEDGDVITIAEDDDLHDAVLQYLNPLRIEVKLNSKNGGLGGTSIPQRSQHDQLHQILNSLFSEFQKSVPEPLRDPLTKLPLELASKLTSSSPVLAEFMEKMKAVCLNQTFNAMAGPKANDTTGGSSKVDDEKGKKPKSSAIKNSKVVDSDVGSSNSKKKGEKVQKVTEGVKFKDARPSRPVDLNIPYFKFEAFPSAINGVDEAANGQVSDVPSEKNKDTANGVDKGKGSGIEDFSGSDKKKEVYSGSSYSSQTNPVGFRFSFSHPIHDNVTEMGGSSSAESTNVSNDSGSSSGWAQSMSDETNPCPFVGPLPSDSNLHGYRHHSCSPHSKRYSHGNDIHRCEGCGVQPIAGPWFKSKVKEHYYLCDVCFAEMGNVSDYIRMDHPKNASTQHMPLKSHPILPPTIPHAMRAPGAKLPHVELDSRFILDVNVLDGTIMAPLTAFTKIWKMRNNGTVKWPYGSQLHWIGGDRLSNSSTVTVDIEIPADGLSVDKELDIAVDFTAPELPGRYVSYWRMASPSGQKFGQRVWVLIQVDASMKNFGETSMNLNLPHVPSRNIIRAPDFEDTSVGHNINGGVSNTLTTLTPPMVPSSSSVFNSTQVENALASLPSGPPFSSGYLSTGVDDDSWDSPLSEPSTPSGFSSPEGLNNSSMEPWPVTSPAVGSAPPLPVMQPSSSANGDGKNDREQVSLRKLEGMGYKQLKLNKKILRMNSYDMEKSIDDLSVLDWDPMLEELQEMVKPTGGF